MFRSARWFVLLKQFRTQLDRSHDGISMRPIETHSLNKTTNFNSFSHNSFPFAFPLFRSNENAGKKLLKQLSKINRPLEIQFTDMLNLMNQCDIVEKQNVKRNQRRSTNLANDEETSKTFTFGKNNPFSVFSGIIPGTKWCGTGDIATTYSDLGELLSLHCASVFGACFECCQTLVPLLLLLPRSVFFSHDNRID